MKYFFFFMMLVSTDFLYANCPILEGEYANCVSVGPASTDYQLTKVFYSSLPADSFIFEGRIGHNGALSQQEVIADGVVRQVTKTGNGGSYIVNVVAKCENNMLIVDVTLPSTTFGAEKILFSATEKGLIKENKMSGKTMNTTKCERRM